MHPTLWIENIGCLLRLTRGNAGPAVGTAMSEVDAVPDGALICEGERILFAGRRRDIPSGLAPDAATVVVDVGGALLTPGFVDPHTHPVFAKSRSDEFAQRIAGKTYEEIAAAGGGIRNSVHRLRETPFEVLLANARKIADRMLLAGTTTMEAKSGYGLSLASELMQLRVIAELNRTHPVDLVPTFLGAHEVPDEYRSDRAAYIRLLVEEMLPVVADEHLAEYCDVFCESHVFSPEETRTILEAGLRYGLGAKVHADELHPSGGSLIAGELHAASADHLVHIDDAGIAALKAGDVVAVLLPATTFFLGSDRYAPARKLIAAGVPVAIATDCNPGSSMVESMSLVLSIACLKLRLSPEEAWNAATVNAATALDRLASIGSLEPGKLADLVLWDADHYREVPYHLGANLVRRVWKRGKDVLK